MADEFDQTALLARAPQRFVEMARSDPQIAAMVPDPAVTSRLQLPGASYSSIIAAALSGYSDRPANGVRDYAIGWDSAGAQVREYRPSYRLTSYAELSRQIDAVASFWQHDPLHWISPGEMVAFISFSGAEMATMDLATVYAQAVSVPLQANLATDAMPRFSPTRRLPRWSPASIIFRSRRTMRSRNPVSAA